MSNKVRSLREVYGISRADLAERGGAKELQIERLENSGAPVTLDLALKISSALGVALNDAFPGSSALLESLEGERNVAKIDKLRKRLRDAGIEPDPRRFHIKLILRGIRDEVVLRVPPGQVDRLRDGLYADNGDDQENVHFVVFDTEDCLVALNVAQVSFAHFLWDVYPPNATVISDDSDEAEEDDEAPAISLWLVGRNEPILLQAEPEIGDDEGELSNLFGSLEDELASYHRLHFLDVDGESVYMRVGDIALLQVSHTVWMEYEDLDDDD